MVISVPMSKKYSRAATCNCPQSKADLCTEFTCAPKNKIMVENEIDRCMAIIEEGTRGEVGQARIDLSNMSQMPVISAFREFDFCGNPIGIYGSLPVEMLHAWLLELLSYGSEAVFSHIKPSNEVELWCQRRYKGDARGHLNIHPIIPKNTDSMVKTDQVEFERRVKMAKVVGSRQSGRDVSKTSFNNGFARNCTFKIDWSRIPRTCYVDYGHP
jgi:hypothetical protein